MPLYEYIGLGSNGKTVSGVIDAEDQAGARLSLKGKGVFLTGPLRESRKEAVSLFGRLKWEARPGLKELSSFTYQLKTLLISGLPMVDALTVLVNEEKNSRLKAVLAAVRDSVKEGETIAAALSGYPEVFNDLYVNMVAAGDAGGMLEGALGNLSEHLERQERVSAKVRAAMIYPAFMALIGVIILSYLLTSVVPKVVTVFQDVGKALPLPTVILITISSALSAYWMLFLSIVMFASYMGYRFYRSDKGKKAFERFFDSLPYIGMTLHSMYMARFGRTLEALLKGGVPLSKALAITSKAAGHAGMGRALSDAEKAVLEGGSLTHSLRESGIFPESVLSLITVGETGGNLEEVFARIGDAKEKELDSRLDTLLTLLEPVMILVMGAIVGFIVLAILLPIFEMSQMSF
ncbi:MAG: type II secretion system F family protein [Deltaproteobacteria bacterium]|nr:type II secretion system F family protein [Deltaproteobacteria bacterium]